MTQGKNTKQTKWSRVVAEWQESGDTQRGYCLRRRLSYEKFKYWRKKIEGPLSDRGLVKVAIEPEQPWSGYWGSVVRCGRVRIELSGEESEEELGRIFRALGSMACS